MANKTPRPKEEAESSIVRFEDEKDMLADYLTGIFGQEILVTRDRYGDSDISATERKETVINNKIRLPEEESTFSFRDFHNGSLLDDKLFEAAKKAKEKNRTLYRIKAVMQTLAIKYGSKKITPDIIKLLVAHNIKIVESKANPSEGTSLEHILSASFQGDTNHENSFFLGLLETAENIRLRHKITHEYPGMGEDMDDIFRTKADLDLKGVFIKKDQKPETIAHGKYAFLDRENEDADIVGIDYAIYAMIANYTPQEVAERFTAKTEKMYGLMLPLANPESTPQDSYEVALELLEIFRQKHTPKKEPEKEQKKPKKKEKDDKKESKKPKSPTHNLTHEDINNQICRDFETRNPLKNSHGTTDSFGLGLRGNINSRDIEFTAKPPAPISHHDSGLKVEMFDEWDTESGTYIRRAVIVRELTEPEYNYHFMHGPQAPLDARINIESQDIAAIRKALSILIPEGRKKIRHLTSGTIDLEALRQAKKDLALGRAPNDRIYYRWGKDERDVALAILIDLSASGLDYPTRRCLEQNKRAIDAIKEGTILFASAALELGDDIGVFAFNSQAASLSLPQTYFITLKDFGEEMSLSDLAVALFKLKPKNENRDGSAIRYLLEKKFPSTSAQTRLLFYIGDGLPQDKTPTLYPHMYKGEYAIADTKKALEEARLQGIVTRYFPIAQKKLEEELKPLWGREFMRVIDSAGLADALTKSYLRETLG